MADDHTSIPRTLPVRRTPPPSVEDHAQGGTHLHKQRHHEHWCFLVLAYSSNKYKDMTLNSIGYVETCLIFYLHYCTCTHIKPSSVSSRLVSFSHGCGDALQSLK